MRNNLVFLFVVVLILFLLQTGCEDKTVAPKPTHWDAVRAIISESPEVFRLGFYDTNQSDTLFYREITESKADIDTGWLVEKDTSQSSPDPFFPYIDLFWGDSLEGSFHYRYEGSWREKPINSKTSTRGFFERWGDDRDPFLGWILQRFSGTVIRSVGATMHPSILYIYSSGVNDTISEPRLLELVKNNETLVFGRGELVTILVEPANSTSDFFFLHVNEGQGYQKIPFTRIDEDSLSVSWTTTSNPDPNRRYCHAIVDIVSRRSVTDTLAAYDSKAWGIIYRIE